MKVTMNSTELTRNLKLFADNINKSAEDTIIELAQLGARQLSLRIQPYGVASNAQKVAEGAVLSDISKAYWNPGRVYANLKKSNLQIANAYIALISDGKLSQAENIARKYIHIIDVRNGDDNGSYLESLRNSKGRVPRSEPIGLTDRNDLEQLKIKKIITAGVAKAGFLQAADAAGSKTSIPKWLRKTKTWGSSRLVKRGWETICSIINDVPYVSAMLPESVKNAAIANAYQNQIKKMQKIADSLARNV